MGKTDTHTPEIVTAGDYGTAAAGDYGAAFAGHRGYATAGYCGAANVGPSGTAVAGIGGTAVAGIGGQAAAGDGGIICVWWHDGDHPRITAGGVGKDGIEPYVLYKCDGRGNLVEA